MANILVVDDELGIRDLLHEILDDEGHTVELAENAAQARAARQRGAPDLVLLDIWMPDTDGITLLKEWLGAGLLTMPVVMMSGHATIDTAVEATRIGALAFLEKPITMDKLLSTVEDGLQRGKSGLMPPAVRASRPQLLATPSARPPLEPAQLAGSSAVDQAPVAANAPTSVSLAPSHEVFDLKLPLREARDEFERAYFKYHLQQQDCSMTRVAEQTGLERTHLYRKLKQLGIDLQELREQTDEA